MWNDLDIYTKSNLMKIYNRHGITSLRDMQQHYDDFEQRQFACGGKLNCYAEGGDFTTNDDFPIDNLDNYYNIPPYGGDTIMLPTIISIDDNKKKNKYPGLLDDYVYDEYIKTGKGNLYENFKKNFDKSFNESFKRKEKLKEEKLIKEMNQEYERGIKDFERHFFKEAKKKDMLKKQKNKKDTRQKNFYM